MLNSGHRKVTRIYQPKTDYFIFLNNLNKSALIYNYYRFRHDSFYQMPKS